MRKIRIKARELFWDKWNLEHIKKHNITQSDIEEALTHCIKARKGYKNRIMIFGKNGDRIIAIVIKKTNKGYYIFSARSASRKERRFL